MSSENKINSVPNGMANALSMFPVMNEKSVSGSPVWEELAAAARAVIEAANKADIAALVDAALEVEVGADGDHIQEWKDAMAALALAAVDKETGRTE